ncbi:hypothetical protein N7468_003862 [Penicillium chermesinum]|uniref:Uncharacterized protein n=1 Tax=Penicillium chermesinum TaxID=63820 RepID=A0A9W9TSN0_9EURO|nr:uncharacterized protein N7468_003862 [Penicillium chermesinum]KAJ5239243.1 hypothetical protein N7468_003862 [Penicillium chermesinum]
MDKLRQEARTALKEDRNTLPQTLSSSGEVAQQARVQDVWADVSTFDHSTLENMNESLYAALQYFNGRLNSVPGGASRALATEETEAVQKLLEWASEAALPSVEFEPIFNDDPDIPDEVMKAQEGSRLKGYLATSLVAILATKSTLDHDITRSPRVIMALACYTSDADPWTTDKAMQNAKATLQLVGQDLPWKTIDEILKDKVRPLFKSSKNPSITSQGRKNFHPVPLSRFEGLSLDGSNNPWKNTDIYATRVLSWIAHQYRKYESSDMEAHFPLLVPVILALIDDSNTTFKAKGCDILKQILEIISDNSSKTLIRMNLVSVFEEAITPCLLSLPTITPEKRSLELLSSAYPTLISLFKAGYPIPSRDQIPANPALEETYMKNRNAYSRSVQKILRNNLISSFHHISSSTPASRETSASFPHPFLSTFLMHWIGVFIQELGFHAIMFLQEIVPVLYTTLSNPFGTAHPPLLTAAVSTTKQLILNAHARIYRWRGEILGGLTSCYLHVIDELDEKIQRDLKITAIALKYTLENSAEIAAAQGVSVADVEFIPKDTVEKEFQELIRADPRLEQLLMVEKDSLV